MNLRNSQNIVTKLPPIISKTFKGVLPHLTGHFSHFQNINILKVWSNSDQNLFTELKNIKIEYFYEYFEKYLECYFKYFSYIKIHTIFAQKCV